MPRWFWPFAMLAAFLLAGPTRAQDVRTDSALAVVPADAAFFSSSLRNKEQAEAVYKSNAYKKFRELQSVRDGLKMLHDELEKAGTPLSAIHKALEQKENKDLLDILIDAVSHEIFCYGGAGWGDLVTAALKANNSQSMAPLEAALSGADPSKAGVRAILLSLQRDRKMLKFPDLVFGFKVSDAKKVQGQLDRLEKLVVKVLEGGPPPLKGRFKKDANGNLTLNLEASMLPWDEINVKDYEEKGGEFDDLMKHLKALKGSVSLGVKGDYLLLGFTTSPADLDKLDKGGKKLATHPDLKVVGKHAREPITSLGYTSKAFARALMAGNDLTQTTAALKRMLNKTQEIPAARKKAIEKDIDELNAEMKKWLPEPTSSVSLEYLVSDGYEGYSYVQGGAAEKVKGAKLRILDHFGGNPIFAAVGAMKADGTGYKAMVKWLQIAYGHLEGIFMDKADDDAKNEYKKYSKVFFPLLAKLNDTTTNLLIPSLENGALGIVIDAKWTSKQWLKFAPESPKPLPMFELALLLGLSDADKFTKALKEYRLTFNELSEKVREASKDNVPELKIPPAESSKVKSGTLYFYPIPEDAMLDKQVVPTLGVSKSVAAFTLSKEHAERLMTSKPLAKKGPLAEKKDFVGAVYFDFHALLTAIEPWVEFGAKMAGDAGGKEKAEQVVKEVKGGFEVLRAFHGFTAGTYIEDGIVVTHSRTVIKDR